MQQHIARIPIKNVEALSISAKNKEENCFSSEYYDLACYIYSKMNNSYMVESDWDDLAFAIIKQKVGKKVV